MPVFGFHVEEYEIDLLFDVTLQQGATDVEYGIDAPFELRPAVIGAVTERILSPQKDDPVRQPALSGQRVEQFVKIIGPIRANLVMGRTLLLKTTARLNQNHLRR